jgi:MYXO-CTERM domain-containing protein
MVLGVVLERIGIVATAFVAFLALFPYYGWDTDPPQHFSVFNNRVPAGPDGGPWLAAAVGLVTLVVLELVRRRVHRSSET